MPERLFYLQEVGEYAGNCMLWWRPSDAGYTCRVEAAGVYTEEQLRKKYKDGMDPNKTRAWPKEFVDAHVVQHVDAEWCRWSEVPDAAKMPEVI